MQKLQYMDSLESMLVKADIFFSDFSMIFCQFFIKFATGKLLKSGLKPPAVLMKIFFKISRYSECTLDDGF